MCTNRKIILNTGCEQAIKMKQAYEMNSNAKMKQTAQLFAIIHTALIYFQFLTGAGLKLAYCLRKF